MINKTFYLTANSSDGFVKYNDRRIDEYENIYFLKFAPNSFKNDLFKRLELYLNEKQIYFETVLKSGTSSVVETIFIPSKSLCITDSNSNDLFIGQNINIFNFVPFYDSQKLSEAKSEILSLTALVKSEKEKMYACLSKAKLIHDKWEKIYIENMDFNKLEEISNTLINKIFSNKFLSKASINENRFFGSMLPEGNANFIENLTFDIKKRFFIKGRPGSGKSTFLKKIRFDAAKRGYDTESYYCSFDSNSMDMLIIPELSVAIFDSTSPHELFPSLKSDEIIDIYALAINPKTDENHSSEIQNLKASYDEKILAAKHHLKLALQISEQINKFYEDAFDFEKSKALLPEIFSSVK